MFIQFSDTGAVAPQELIDIIQQKLINRNISFNQVYFPCADDEPTENKHKVVVVKNTFPISDSGIAALLYEDLSTTVHEFLHTL